MARRTKIILILVIGLPILFAILYLALAGGNSDQKKKIPSPHGPTYHSPTKPQEPNLELKVPPVLHSQVDQVAINKYTFDGVSWPDRKEALENGLLAAQLLATNTQKTWRKNYKRLAPYIAASAKKQIYYQFQPLEVDISKANTFEIQTVQAYQDPQTAQREILVMGQLTVPAHQTEEGEKIPKTTTMAQVTVFLLPNEPLITAIKLSA